MVKTKQKKALVLSIVGVITLIAVIVGATYAYFQAQGGGAGSTNVNIQTATTDNLSFQLGEAINLTANQEDFAQGMGNKSGSTTAKAILTANNATNTATRNYYIYLDITNNEFVYTTDDEQAELLLKITDPDGAEVTTINGLDAQVTSGGVTGFDITTKRGLIKIADNYEITANPSKTDEWMIEIILVNLDSDQNANTGKTFNANIIIQEEKIPTTLADVCPEGGNLADCVELLNTTVGDSKYTGLYYHDADLANGAVDNSYRYSGANPNNYVCFGSTDSPCPTENLYRIIGAFDDDKDTNYQVKLIKADYVTSAMLGTDGRDYYEGVYSYVPAYYKGSMDISTIAVYSWNNDTSVSSKGSSNWTTSEFNTINLNTNYWNYLGQPWQNLIVETTWRLGGVEISGLAKKFYDGERNNAGYGNNPTTYTDEIGLMYPSDYGYGASPDVWTADLYFYDNSTIIANNWLYMGLVEWTIAPISESSNLVSMVNASGGLLFIYPGRVGSNAARPTFYLNSNVEFSGGSGTSSDPFTLVVG